MPRQQHLSLTPTTATAQQQQQQQKCTRVPPHLNSDTVTAMNNGANVLIDGLVAFKYTRAAAVTATTASNSNNNNNNNTNSEADDRKARARLLANLLNDNNNNHKTSSAAATTTHSTPPPAKGSCVVLTLSWEDATSECEHQRRALVLLASYYNLLLLVAVPPDVASDGVAKKYRDTIVDQLRGTKNNNNSSGVRQLTTDLLPEHRIVWTATITGRVAFVRQLQRIELVLDYDPEVKNLLSRFGHRVVVYGQQQQQTLSTPPESGNAVVLSKLGRALL